MQAVLSVDLELLGTGACSLVINVLVDARRAESLLGTGVRLQGNVSRDRIKAVLDH